MHIRYGQGHNVLYEQHHLCSSVCSSCAHVQYTGKLALNASEMGHTDLLSVTVSECR